MHVLLRCCCECACPHDRTMLNNMLEGLNEGSNEDLFTTSHAGRRQVSITKLCATHATKREALSTPECAGMQPRSPHACPRQPL